MGDESAGKGEGEFAVIRDLTRMNVKRAAPDDVLQVVRKPSLNVLRTGELDRRPQGVADELP